MLWDYRQNRWTNGHDNLECKQRHRPRGHRRARTLHLTRRCPADRHHDPSTASVEIASEVSVDLIDGFSRTSRILSAASRAPNTGDDSPSPLFKSAHDEAQTPRLLSSAATQRPTPVRAGRANGATGRMPSTMGTQRPGVRARVPCPRQSELTSRERMRAPERRAERQSRRGRAAKASTASQSRSLRTPPHIGEQTVGPGSVEWPGHRQGKETCARPSHRTAKPLAPEEVFVRLSPHGAVLLHEVGVALETRAGQAFVEELGTWSMAACPRNRRSGRPRFFCMCAHPTLWRSRNDDRRLGDVPENPVCEGYFASSPRGATDPP